jgi:hypothetical protein
MNAHCATEHLQTGHPSRNMNGGIVASNTMRMIYEKLHLLIILSLLRHARNCHYLGKQQETRLFQIPIINVTPNEMLEHQDLREARCVLPNGSAEVVENE